jgi:pimeloyl-ACP methyl ester carboxylesterase
MRRQQIAIPAGTVAAVEFGPPSRPIDILFLHANGFNALTYRDIFAELNPSLRLMAVDLRGHGLTALTIPPEHPGWQLYADDLLDLIATLDSPPRLIAGHSMGASTALLALPRLPSFVRTLMLFEPVIVHPAIRTHAAGRAMWDLPLVQAALRRKTAFASREDAFAAYDGRGAFRTWREAMLRDYLEDGLIPGDAGFSLACTPQWEAANFATFGIADPLAALFACRVPIAIFTAAHGSTCALDEAKLPASVQVETLAGTSHFLPMERPEIVCRALAEALA